MSCLSHFIHAYGHAANEVGANNYVACLNTSFAECTHEEHLNELILYANTCKRHSQAFQMIH